jgi:hypothetical protein
VEEDRLTAIARRNKNQLIWLSIGGIVACAAMLFVDDEHTRWYVAGIVGSVASLGYGIKTRIS